MEVKVKKMYDISDIAVPEELTKWKVSDEQVNERLAAIAKLAAAEREADSAEAGDCVVLSCTEGALKERTILLYPGLKLPGAEAAEEAVLGLSAGSELTVELNGREKLKVKKILRRTPVPVDDVLIKEQAIDGVGTVAEYCEWYRAEAGRDNREMALKQIKNYFLDTIVENSEFDYDKEEMDAVLEKQLAAQLAYEEQMTGREEEFSEEERAEMKASGSMRFLRAAVEEEICKKNGFTFTRDMFEDEIREMMDMPGIEDMPGVEDMLDEYRDMYVSQAYMEKASELLDEQASSCLEVE